MNAKTSAPRPTILVAGDLVIDHHIYQGARHHFGDSSPGVTVTRQAGGAHLVADLLKALPGFENRVFSERVMPDAGVDKDIGHHAYAFWRPLPADGTREKQFWRCDQGMGFGDRSRIADKQSAPPCKVWPPQEGRPQQPDIIVISEGGMGFRDTAECWQPLALANASLIILKTAWPLAQGELWTLLTAKHRSRIMVVVSADELRKSNARLSTGLSWEATFQALLHELAPGGRLNGLTHGRHLIVTFGSEGAAWFDFGGEGRVCFVYRAGCIEHDHAQGTEGTAFGFLTCVTAALAQAAACNPEATLEADFGPALEAGLAAMRDLREKGHGAVTEPPGGFPVARLAGVICNPDICYTRATLPWPKITSVLAGDRASILSLTGKPAIRPGTKTAPPAGRESAWEFARLIALHGPVALENLPHLRVGKLITADRGEVEALRVLAQVIRRYDKHDKGKKPLSIGVFGPPGAGKSFAVKEIAEAFLGKRAEWLEFNLSQFDSQVELNGAFHRIRDAVLQQKLPVAFFDEFDARSYSWLQYLLAPMQDGRFQQGQLTHTLGKAIFIFAGGTSWTFDTFGPPEPKAGGPSNHVAEQRFAEFRLAKGPDFKSRLDAFLDVVGPNRRVKLAPRKAGRIDFEIAGHRFVEDLKDTWFPIRRALFFRTELGLAPEHRLDIDPGLLDAILRVPRYTHGSRSLVKILTPLKTALPAALQPSHLPAPAQLAMHTTADEFHRLCTAASPICSGPPVVMTPETEKLIASAIHETWRELSRRLGSLKKEDDLSFEKFPGEEDLKRMEEELNSPQLTDAARQQKEEALADLRVKAFKKKSNYAAARRVPEVLFHAGLRLEPGLGTDGNEERAVRQHIEYHLELLANAEHQGWMKWHFDHGWSYHPKRDDKKQRHDCLKPFTELKEAERCKDREQVRHYPDFARHVGYRIVFALPVKAPERPP